MQPHLADGTAKKIIESSDTSEDRFTALNSAAFNSGIYIEIPKNVQVADPIHIISCLSDDGVSVISRNVISAAQSSSSSIVQEMYSPKSQGQQAYMELLTTDVQQNAKIDVTSLQMMDESSVNFSTRNTNMASDSTANWYLGLFGTMLSRYRIAYNLNGSGASVNDSEVIFGSGEQSFDIQANANHISASTEAKIVEKSILRGTKIKVSLQLWHDCVFLIRFQVHRLTSINCGISKLVIPACAGRIVEKEVRELDEILSVAKAPHVVVLGSKVAISLLYCSRV